ncbi:MAG: glutamyl-tRNA reductase [Gammaproteobacteria bacterium]|nr:glutamyl-tRNA reductase [Gammaproteobacteria bacterium]NNF60788.1 glutamyl-tRNA reductase [Gammaproteobacteria bacterium]NNM20201.1 glutamyl-tRNA reductase [Gammaproteobacteria bacterium]
MYVLGVNHRTAPVEIREQVAFDPARLPEALRELHATSGVRGAVILSTCNRTELYCDMEAAQADNLCDWLAEHRGLSAAARDSLYVLDGPAAVRHVFEVACGLDSMVLGEPQILGQVKQAYAVAQQHGTADSLLNLLFQQVLAVAKQVRTDTSIGASPVSVASTAVSLARQVYSRFDKLTALLVGAGETTQLTARHLHSHGIGRMVIANRSVERARGLALQFGAYAISLDEVATHLAEADFLFSSTASNEPVIDCRMVESALQKRRHRPMFMVDLAVPRDIAADVADLEDVYLYTVDDLHSVIERNQRSRAEAAVDARVIIEAATKRFDKLLATRDAAPLIRQLRGQVEQTRDITVEQARRMLKAGRDPVEVIEFIANTLTSRLLHSPSTTLRQAGEEADVGLSRAAAELFGLSLDPEDSD